MLASGKDSLVSWSASYGSIAFNGVKDDSNEEPLLKSKRVDTARQATLKQRVLSPKCLRAANFALMCLTIFGYGLCVSLFAPFFPTEAEKRGVSSTVVGLIFSSYTFVMFIGTPLTGMLVRHLGLNFMTGAGMFLAGGSTALFGFLDKAPAGVSYVVLCFAARMVEGCGACLYMTAAYSSAAMMYPKQVSFVYAIMETVLGLGRMVGPSAGGALFNLGGFSLPFFLVGGMLIFIGFISVLLLMYTSSITNETDESTVKDTQSEANPSWLHFYRVSYHAWVLSISLFATSILTSFFEPTLASHLATTFGLTDPAQVGLIFLLSSFIYGTSCLAVGKLATVLANYAYYIMAFGALDITICMILVGPTPLLQGVASNSIGLTIGSYACVNLGVGFLFCPSAQALATALYNAGYPDCLETSSLIATIYNGMWFGGGFFGPTIAGALVDSVGFPVGTSIMAGIAAWLLILVLVSAVIGSSSSWCLKGPGNRYETLRGSVEASKTVSVPKRF